MTDAWQTHTLLFSDLADSAALWHANPAGAATLLQRQATLTRQAVEEQGGHVFKTVGDLHCVVFERPEAALAAAMAAQRAMAAGPWDTSPPPRIRIALHSGTPVVRAGDFFGPPVNQVSRLLHAAHGGQTLLTDATRQALGSSTPADIAWRNLGRHTLRDVLEPVRIFQADPAELAQAFPPLATEEYDPHNLPAQMTSFIGRESELNALRALLDQSRLITLTGPGGVGKTRLALQLAAEAHGRFADGRFFVALGAINDPSLVPGAIAAALDLTGPGGSGTTDAIAAFLKAKHLLLVLDNFEHVSVAAPVISTLLAAAPRLTALVTSRQPLRLSGEQEYAVPLLDVPDRTTAGPDEIGRVDAVRLFVARAQASRPQFALTADNAPALAGICQRLDGLPLAIELAAARSTRISPARILDQLDDRLGFLDQGSRDLPPRQQALRTAIGWSYDLLEPAHQRLFRRLGIFAGGFTLDAAEAILADPMESDAFVDLLDGITTLVDNSLLQVATAPDGDPRYTMLQSIQAYAQERLEQSDERPALAPRHAAWYLQFALEARTHSRTTGELLWLKRIQSEMDNLRGALAWLAQHGGADDHLRLVSALWWFWLVRPDTAEGRSLLRRALERPDGLESPARADALAGAGTLASLQGDLHEAAAMMAQSIPLMRAAGDQRALIRTLINAGVLARQQHDLPRATALLREANELVQRAADKRALGVISLNLGDVALDRGDYDEAQARYERAYREHEILGDEAGMAYAIGQQAELALGIDASDDAARLFQQALAMDQDQDAPIARGANLLGLGRSVAGTEPDRARALFEEALAVLRQVDSRDGVALAQLALARVRLSQGDPAGAASLLAEVIPFFAAGDEPLPALDCFTCLAAVAVARDDAVRATRLLGAVAALRGRIPVVPTPRERREMDDALAAARSVLTQGSFDAAFGQGQSLSLGDAATLAREIIGIPSPDR